MGTFARFLARPSTTRMLLAVRLEFSAIDADERRRLIEAIPQPHEGVKATLCGAQVRGSHGHLAQGSQHVIGEGVVHTSQCERLSGIDLREFGSETAREATAEVNL